MTPYIIGIALIELSRIIGKDTERKKTAATVICASVFILILGLRHQSMGIDLQWTQKEGYLGAFEQLASKPWSTTSFLNYELGFIWFDKLIGIFTTDRQWYLAVCAAVSVIPAAIMIRKYSSDIQTSFIVFFGTPCFVILFSGLRQAIAVAILFFSSKFIIEKKPIKFIFTVFLAFLFHDTSYLFLLAYPIYNFKARETGKKVSILVLIVLYLLRKPFILTVGKLISEKAEVQSTGAFTMFAIYTAGLIVFFVLLKNAGRRTSGFINIYYLACLAMVFSTVNTIAMRASYYFTPFLFLIVPELYNYKGRAGLYIIKTSDRNNKLLYNIIINVLFIALGLYFIYTTGWAKAYPYRFFTQTAAAG